METLRRQAITFHLFILIVSGLFLISFGLLFASPGHSSGALSTLPDKPDKPDKTEKPEKNGKEPEKGKKKEEDKKGGDKKDKPKAKEKEKEGDDEGGEATEDEDEEESGDEEEEDSPRKGAKPASIEEAYVRDNLEKFLHPTSVSFFRDGRVKLYFDFKSKNSEHEFIFQPHVGSGLRSNFRWSLRREEEWESYTDGTSKTLLAGIKIGDAGTALLNCCFADDVEAQIEYQHNVTFNKNQNVAVVFCSEKKKGVGSNVGTQCQLYKAGKPGTASGKVEEIITQKAYKFKLLVKSGIVEAHRDSHMRSSMNYDRKDLECGRIGFQWSGGPSGVIASLTVVGKLDYQKSFNEMKKGKN